MNQALVQLGGELIDIEDLLEILSISSWQIIKIEDNFYLTSENLNNIPNNRAVIAKAQEMLDILNGAANILDKNHQNVTPGSILRLDNDGRHHHVILTDSIIIRLKSLRNTSSGKVIDKINNNWLVLSETNEAVRDVIFFFNEITWLNLYKIYEVICKDVGGEKILQKLITKDELVSFRQTGQSREAIGKLARHGKKIPPPKKPMNLNEAYILWKRIFEDWIKTK